MGDINFPLSTALSYPIRSILEFKKNIIIRFKNVITKNIYHPINPSLVTQPLLKSPQIWGTVLINFCINCYAIV